jgi:subtilisin-like proprotein convertase family protein
MKAKILAAVMVVMGISSGRAALYTETFSGGNALIPDGNPVGMSFAGLVNDIPVGSTVAGLTVGLTVNGGYNGDLYAYLVSPGGALVPLLNRPGVTGGNAFGFGGSGLNLSLLDSASSSIQTAPETAGAQFLGNYLAAGSLASLDGSQANGTWTLYFADLSAGGGQATLGGWSLGFNVTPVPEPVNVALGVFGTLLVAGGFYRHLRSKGKKVPE